MRDTFLHDTGAYDPYGLTVPINSQCTLLGPYVVPRQFGGLWFDQQMGLFGLALRGDAGEEIISLAHGPLLWARLDKHNVLISRQQ